MGEYNFANLSPYDFEVFTRDLLNASQDLQLRAFAPGRDRGIDLRGWQSTRPSGYVIVQCKHMQASSYTSLRAKVVMEAKKLRRLKRQPDRYVLATTKPLTSANVDELFDILQPFCKSTDDIMDAASIESMLAEHPDVLRRHYKLWITSTPVLERIIHSGIYNRSEAHLSELVHKSRTFVQPKAFPKARQILEENHTCIISGPPGVGKTTLADMLCLGYLANGFELIVVSEDILEADSVYSATRKQVFIYDDFLGRTDLRDKLGKNEDNRIVQFIKRVNKSPNHRFILTTREYILRAARIRYDRLDVDEINPSNLVLEISSYTEFQRGLILYQHLAFSDGISAASIRELVKSRLFWSIVRHRNYTPRHISDALNEINRLSKLGEAADTLADYLLEVLNNPTRMWSHALKELSADAQRLFLTMVLLPMPVLAELLQVAYTSQAVSKSEPFMDSLRSIEGSFVAIKNSRFFPSVDFRNPSLHDFANRYVDDNSDVLDALLSVPVLFEQIITTFNLAMAQTEHRVNTVTRKRVDSPPKFPKIKGWVERHADKLISCAIELFDTEPVTAVVYWKHSRIRQLLSLIAVYGLPLASAESEKLRAAARVAMSPLDRSSAEEAMQFLKDPAFKNLLDRILQEDSAAVMRRNVLDRDNWKFHILLRLDRILNVETSVSWQSWGVGFVEYVRELIATDDLPLEIRLRDVIDELLHMQVTLDIDLSAEIADLESRNSSHYMRGSGNYDEYDEVDAPGPDSEGEDSDWSEQEAYAYECEELEEIFDSLL